MIAGAYLRYSRAIRYRVTAVLLNDSRGSEQYRSMKSPKTKGPLNQMRLPAREGRPLTAKMLERDVSGPMLLQTEVRVMPHIFRACTRHQP